MKEKLYHPGTAYRPVLYARFSETGHGYSREETHRARGVTRSSHKKRTGDVTDAGQLSKLSSMLNGLEQGASAMARHDAAVYPQGDNALEFVPLNADGMTPAQALRAGTSVDADLLGLRDRIGTLEAGKLAHIVAIPGDPLKNIKVTQSVLLVMKEGTIYRNDRDPTSVRKR